MKHRLLALALGILAACALPAQRAEGNLRAGDMAPDFYLKVRGSDRWLRLSDFRGVKPVALVFGSFT